MRARAPAGPTRICSELGCGPVADNVRVTKRRRADRARNAIALRTELEWKLLTGSGSDRLQWNPRRWSNRGGVPDAPRGIQHTPCKVRRQQRNRVLAINLCDLGPARRRRQGPKAREAGRSDAKSHGSPILRAEPHGRAIYRPSVNSGTPNANSARTTSFQGHRRDATKCAVAQERGTARGAPAHAACRRRRAPEPALRSSECSRR